LSDEIAASCDTVGKIYRSASGEVHALTDIDAEFVAGQVTAVMGPSGSGKSSLLRIVAGLERPTSGWVEVGGVMISAMGTRKRRRMRRRLVGYVFQRPSDNLISYLTLLEHMHLAARLRGHGSGEEIDEVLELLGLTPRVSNLPHQLSGGEQQRAAFGQAVIGHPALVVADEPTAELDAKSGANLLSAIHRLAEAGTTVVVATHDDAVAAASDRVYRIERGELVA